MLYIYAMVIKVILCSGFLWFFGLWFFVGGGFFAVQFLRNCALTCAFVNLQFPCRD